VGHRCTPLPVAAQSVPLDTFQRPNGNIGPSWAGNTSPTIFRINAGYSQARRSGVIRWKTQFGAKQEAFVTLRKLSTTASQQGLLLKAKAMGTRNASFIKVVIRHDGRVQIWSKTANHAVVLRKTLSAVFHAGDKLGVRTASDGTLTVFRNGLAVGGANLRSGAGAWSASQAAAGGAIGITVTGATTARDARFDDFGGGTLR
jgi:hypothetical protein